MWNDAFDADVCDPDIQYVVGEWSGVRTHQLSWETITPLCSPAMAQRLSAPDDLLSHRLLHVLGNQEGWGTWLRATGATTVNPGKGLLCSGVPLRILIRLATRDAQGRNAENV